MESSVYNCNVIKLPKQTNPAGNLTFIENERHIPFTVKRVYYLYDIPCGEARGGHAHYNLRQLLVATSGSFDVLIDDGENKKMVTLNRPDYGLLIVPGIWRELTNFSSGATCFVLASHAYDESDYIRNYDEFKQSFKG